jgi:hypothetical protein
LASNSTPPWTALFLACLFFAGCATVEKRPLTSTELEDLFLALSREDLKAENFFATGQLIVEGESYSKAPVLLVGRRSPLALRIEITHPFGKPLAHILLKNDGFVLVSFQDSRYYVGEAKALQGYRGFPADLPPIELWGLARGYPPVEGYRPLPSRLGEMRMSGPPGETEKIIRLDGMMPSKVIFPSRGTEIEYENMKPSAGVPFAETVVVHEVTAGSRLTIRREQAHFNTSLPDELFHMDIPQGFEEVVITGFKAPAVSKDQDL